MIIDGGRCENIIFKSLVKVLGLKTEKHDRPYKKGWIKKGPELTVAETCKVTFFIRKYYQNSISCDIVDKSTCHLLLGRLWLFNTNAIHQKIDNTYTIIWQGKKITLIPTVPTNMAPSMSQPKKPTLLVILAKEFNHILLECK